MSRLFLLAGASRHNPEVDAWFSGGDHVLRGLARDGFERLLACGGDVGQVLHDGHPTVCVEGAAFAYVNAFAAHVNLGFFHGAALDDPAGLLEGTGKRMRHVKLRAGQACDDAALDALVVAAYRDIRQRLAAGE